MAGSRLGWAVLAACVAGAWLPSVSLAQPKIEAQRGEELYALKCVGCHDEQVHRRAGKLATDWDSLVFQVRRWRHTTALDWSEEDVLAVTHYLNVKYYLFPAPLRSVWRANEPIPAHSPAVRTGAAAAGTNAGR